MQIEQDSIVIAEAERCLYLSEILTFNGPELVTSSFIPSGMSSVSENWPNKYST